MTAPEVNIRLLNKVMAQVEAEAAKGRKKRWEQFSWRSIRPTIAKKAPEPTCGTAMCFAGWAIQLDPKSKWVWENAELKVAIEKGYNLTELPLEFVLATDEEIRQGITIKTRVLDKTVDSTFAAERAKSILGLTEEEADRLFAASNTRKDLKAALEDIKARHQRQLRAKRKASK